MAARELRLAAQRAGLALRPLSSDSFSAALNVASKASMRGMARVEQFGDAALGIASTSIARSRIGPSASSTTACTSAAWLGK